MTATTPATRRPRTLARSERWDASLADFTDAMTRAGLADSTIERVVKHCRKFAAETGLTPYDVTASELAGWLDSRNVTPDALRVYRTSLRTFYRWAHRAGRVPDDPTTRPGPDPRAKHVPADWQPLLAQWRRWMHSAGRSRETVVTYTDLLRRLARQTGASDPWALDTTDLVDWMARQRWGLEQLRSGRSALRSFYGWAYDLALVDHNPAAHLPKLRATPPNPRPASEATYRAALDAAPTTADRLMLRLAAELGLRRGEACQVHSRHLTTGDDGLWWLEVLGKGNKRRRVPVPDDLARDVLTEAAGGFLVPGDIDGHLSAQRVGNRVSRLLPPGVTMHALRHRFATVAYNFDRDVFTVQRLLGHSSPATTQRYVHTTDDTARRLVARVGVLSWPPSTDS